MAQFIKPLNVQDGEQRYEVVMLAAGKDGSVVEATNPLPVTLGEGEINITGPVTIPGTVEISNDLGNPVPVSANTTANSNSNPIFVKGTSDTSFFSPTQSDAFGRLRVSQPVTLFDSSFRYSDNEKFSTALTGSGSSTYNSTYNTVDMVVSGGTDSVVRESKRVFPYQPGKSLLILTTFTLNNPTANLRQRVGYFGAQNGIFLETDGTDIYIVKRNAGSDTRVLRANWNGSSIPGLNLEKSHIFFIDIEWLGVGSVRTGFVIDGQFIVAHTFHHANSIVGTYMQTAVLPVRYEITSSGAAGTLRQICSSVMSEGGYEGTSQYYFATNAPSAGVDLGTEGASIPLISIKLKSSQPDAIILPAEIDIIALSNQVMQYKLILNGTLTSPSFADHATSQCQIDTTASAITGGTVIQQGFITQNNKVTVGGLQNFNFQLGRTLSGTSDIITLVGVGYQNNIKALASLGWFQLT